MPRGATDSADGVVPPREDRATPFESWRGLGTGPVKLEKIVILLDRMEGSHSLAALVRALFPECEVRVCGKMNSLRERREEGDRDTGKAGKMRGVGQKGGGS